MSEQGGKQDGKAEHVVKGKWAPGEVMDSMTGVEEDDVARAFGAEPLTLVDQDRHAKVRRALLFVLHRRDGANPADAAKAAKAMRADHLFEFFAEVNTDGTGAPDEDSEPGKGTPELAAAPTVTPASGSASASDRGSTAS